VRCGEGRAFRSQAGCFREAEWAAWCEVHTWRMNSAAPVTSWGLFRNPNGEPVWYCVAPVLRTGPWERRDRLDCGGDTSSGSTRGRCVRRATSAPPGGGPALRAGSRKSHRRPSEPSRHGVTGTGSCASGWVTARAKR